MFQWNILSFNILIGLPLVDRHLLLVFVADDEPDDSSEPPDQVEQGQDQPHHVNLGENVLIEDRDKTSKKHEILIFKTLTSLSKVQHPCRIATYMARPENELWLFIFN